MRLGQGTHRLEQRTPRWRLEGLVLRNFWLLGRWMAFVLAKYSFVLYLIISLVIPT